MLILSLFPQFSKKHDYKTVHLESNLKNHINKSQLKSEKPVLPFKYRILIRTVADGNFTVERQKTIA